MSALFNGSGWTAKHRRIASGVLLVAVLSAFGLARSIGVNTAPEIDLKSVSTDSGVVERGQCITIALGADAVSECGALRVTHALPGVRTMNRLRTPALIYNSAHANPFPIVRANVRLPAGKSALSSVTAVLTVEGRIRARAIYPGAAWPDTVARIAIGYDASNDATGFHRYELKVKSEYGTTADSTVVRGQLVVVNRSGSTFGPGWWLAGLERLYIDRSGNPSFWVGGDGSTRRYFRVDSIRWSAARVERPDTVIRRGRQFVRLLPGGDSAVFDLSGRHIATANRLGRQTRFTYLNERLDSIVVPTPSTTVRRAYKLAYGLDGRLIRVATPAGAAGGLRFTTLTRAGTQTVIRDPDQTTVSYNVATNSNRIAAIVDRKGDTLHIAYGAAYLIDSATWNLAGSPSVTRLRHAEAAGLPGTRLGALPAGAALTLWDAPRTDVGDSTMFWINRYGAPSKIVDPLGRATSVEYNDTAFGVLPSRVTHPNGRVIVIKWNRRGNLEELRDSTSHLTNGLPTAVTRYTFNAVTAPDDPDSIIDPENIVTRLSYTTAGILSSVTAGNGHVTQFSHFKVSDQFRGLLASVVDEGVAVYNPATGTKADTSVRVAFSYDSLGNLAADTSALGFVRRYTSDAVGRVTMFSDQVYHQTEFVYDPMDRVTEVARHPAVTDSPYSVLRTRYVYGRGLLEEVFDPRNVKRSFTYNTFAQVKTELDDYNRPHTILYNAAGQPEAVQPRYLWVPNQFIRNSYDAAGRLTKTSWPARDSTLADSVMYEYDDLDNITLARTSAYQISRTYYANGLLKTEIHSVIGGSSINTHEYTYDRAGRRTSYRIGPATGSHDLISYRYDASTGELRAIAVRWRDNAADSVLFRWDALGRRDLLTYSPHRATGQPLTVEFAYDADGRFRRLCSRNPSGTAIPDALDLLVSIESIDADGLIRHHKTGADANCPSALAAVDVRNDYDSRHRLLLQVVGSSDSTVYRYDESDNMVVLRRPTDNRDMRFEIPAAHNNVLRYWKRYDVNPSYNIRVFHDSAGARVDEAPYANTTFDPTKFSRRLYWYDGLGRLTGTGQYVYNGRTWLGDHFNPFADTISTAEVQWVQNPRACEYAPVGRMARPCDNGAPFLAYDGDNVVRTAGDTQVGYTFVHGPGVDDPLLGRREGAGGQTFYVFWVTDGAGRQFAVATYDGLDHRPAVQYEVDGKYAGSIANARTFKNERFQDAHANALSFYRNRFYDRETGRWIQEDPLGVRAGFNQYAFVDNNPASYTDPFGLCPIPPSNCVDVALFALSAKSFIDKPSWKGAGAALLDAAGLVPGIPAIAGLRRAATAAHDLGTAGEAAAGIVKNTQRIPSATGTAAYRIPDALSATVLAEVKNVSRLSYTSQLRDYVAYAKQTGRTFELYVRSDTRLSVPLQQAVARGDIRLRFLEQ